MSKSRAMLPMCVKLVLLAALGGQTIALALDACSGARLSGNGNCGTNRDCGNYDVTHNCTGTAFSVKTVDKCTTEGANSGDNCIRTTDQVLCATRYGCSQKMYPDMTFYCAISDSPIGNSYLYKVADGGDCIVE